MLSTEKPGGAHTFFVIAATFALLTTGGTLPIPLYTLWGAEMRFGAGATTWIFAIYVLGTLVALIFLGGLSDQVGRRPLAFAALGLTIASTVLFVLAANMAMLLIARFLSGMGVGLITSAATAALAESYTGNNSKIPAMVSTAANMGGLGVGPLVAGSFAQYLPHPTVFVFVLFLALVVAVTILTIFVPETNPRPIGHTINWAPRVGVPPSARAVYGRSAVAVVPTFTLLGLFSSLTPRFIRDILNIDNLAVAGAATFVLFEIGVIAQLLFRGRDNRRLVLTGLPLLALALGFVLTGLLMASLPLFALGTVIGGFGAGLTFMGGLGQLTSAVPHETHAKSVAAYFIAAQSGLAVPVLAIGVLTHTLTLQTATITVILTVIALTAAAFVLNLQGSRR